MRKPLDFSFAETLTVFVIFNGEIRGHSYTTALTLFNIITNICFLHKKKQIMDRSWNDTILCPVSVTLTSHLK